MGAPRVAATIVLLTGCNQVLGLDQTGVVDARYFDAPADAAAACPGPGVEPRFRPAYTQIPVPDCSSYIPTREWGKAVAYCPSLDIAEGDDDQMLAMATTLPPSDRYRYPRVSDDGQLLFVENAATTMLDIFRRDGDTWSYTRSLFDASYRFMSNPTSTSPRRAVQTDFNGTSYSLLELEEQADGSWSQIASTPVSDFGVGAIDQPALTSDGLRVTYIGQVTFSQAAVFLAQRGDLGSSFANPVRLTTVPMLPGIETPFLTDDCGRFYFSALRTVFYQTSE